MPLFTDPTPKPLDSEWALLAKIAQLLQEGCAGGGGGAGVSSLSVNGGPPQTGAVSITTGGGGSVTSVNGDPGPAVLLDSGEIPEGANLYYTAARFNTAFSAKTTTDLAEGANLYFTNARAIAATLTGFVAGAGTVTAADTILTALQKVVGNATASTLQNFDDTNANADASILINSGATEIIKVIGATTFVQLNTSRIHRNLTSSVLAILSGTGKSDGAFFEVAGDTNATVGYATITTKGQSAGAGSFSILNAPLASLASVTRSTMGWEGNWLHTPIWNDAGATFVAFDVNPTNTASAAGALLGRFRASSVTQWSVSKAGDTVQIGGILAATASGASFNVAAATAETSISTGATGAIALNLANQISGASGLSTLLIEPTWDTSGSPTAILLQVDDTTSGANAKLLDLQLDLVSQFSVSKAGNVVGLGTLSAAAALFTVSATGVLQLANGTALGADPTAATSQWAVGGEWQYRSSAASEGAGQTNRVHNRAQEVIGGGTDYTLTTTAARVDFGSTDAEVVLPTAGTYQIQACVQFTASALSANDAHGAVLRNATDSTFVGVVQTANLGASFSGTVHISGQLTITTTKTIQIYAANFTAARGLVVSGQTSISYVRLS